MGLREQKKYRGLSHLVTFPEKIAIKVWQKILPYNPNNLGNWSIKEIKPDQETSVIERELIWQMIDLYGGSKNDLEGYVTSGGTESNIFSSWLGRKFFESKNIKKEKIILVKTSLTHYSIEKAADIIGVETFITPLNEEDWKMDVNGLEKSIRELKKQGYKGFLMPLTLGYTLTGTFDPFEEICGVMRRLKKDFQDIEFFLWLDAAINGLIEPFLNESFKPFKHPEIKTFLTDFHKFGFTPIPAGIILYRKELRELIEKQIDYLSEKDNTLLGTRSGIAPVACWAIINYLGKNGFKKIILKRIKKKDDFIKENKDIKGIDFISCSHNLNCGILVKKSFRDKKWVKKAGLNFREIEVKFVHSKRKLLMSKAFF